MNSPVYPRQELVELTREALSQGITATELAEMACLGDDGYGIQARLEQLYVWLERNRRHHSDELP